MVQGWAWNCPTHYPTILQQGQALLCTPRMHRPTTGCQQLWIPQAAEKSIPAQQKAAFPQSLNHLVLAQKNKQAQAAA